MSKLISLYAVVIMTTALFTVPASAASTTLMVNEDVVYTDCMKLSGAAQLVCLRRMDGSDR
ncbi:hypothetical protein [Psychromonas aquimarina]|uniref:hypothetical protein n=1 Tax=Psychromonas aquimarina TaxID=444919 RepID=UPI0004921FAF|nr:hypothetical protein [Psychromonas aquimarina]